jgi:hypothetical protein
MNTTRTRRAPASVLREASPTAPGLHIDLQRLERLRRLTRWLDTRWRIPGTRIPIGLDGIASLIPVAGDTTTGLVSAYMVMEAARFDLPKGLIARMIANVGLDWALGSIPVIGTIFDIGFRANRRNLDLLHEHLEQRLAERMAKTR